MRNISFKLANKFRFNKEMNGMKLNLPISPIIDGIV